MRKSRAAADGQFSIEWSDAGKEPQCAPNPFYPNGCHIDFTETDGAACTVDVPYPAKRIGHYVVRCKLCGMSVGCTTAGRQDDPRSLTIPCQEKPQ